MSTRRFAGAVFLVVGVGGGLALLLEIALAYSVSQLPSLSSRPASEED